MKDLLFILGCVLAAISMAFWMTFFLSLNIFCNKKDQKRRKKKPYSILFIAIFLMVSKLFEYEYPILTTIVRIITITWLLYKLPDFLRLSMDSWKEQKSLRISGYSLLGFTILSIVTFYAYSKL